MSSDKKIGAPFTLASLPRPINTINGRTLAAGVCSISSAKKKKRTEIAVGVDGEGILLYSVGCTIPEIWMIGLFFSRSKIHSS